MVELTDMIKGAFLIGVGVITLVVTLAAPFILFIAIMIGLNQ